MYNKIPASENEIQVSDRGHLHTFEFKVRTVVYMYPE